MAAAALLGAATTVGTAAATIPHAPGTLPIAWRVTSAAALNEPALTPNGVATTSDNTAIERALTHGRVLWKHAIPDQMEFHFTLGPPTVANGAVDAVVSTDFGQGVADFALANGTLTQSGPSLHNLEGQLVVHGAQSTRVVGGYGSNAGPFFELTFGGRTWFVDYGPARIGVPAIIDSRVFETVDGALNAYDPAQVCPPLPIPNPPAICAPIWYAQLAGAPNTASRGVPGDVVVSDSSGVVTAFVATTGSVAWTSTKFGTPLAPTASPNGVVYVGGADGVLRALDAATGALRWRGNAGAPIGTKPTVAGGRVYVATDNGRLVTFPVAGCGSPVCAPTAVGNATLPGLHAAGAPLVRNHVAVVAYGNHLVAFTV